VNNWEVQLEVEEAETGPFIGDSGFIYTYTTSRKLTGSLEATVPQNKDTGQTVLLSGALNSTNITLILTTTLGYVVTIPSGIISSFTLGQDAAEAVTLSFDFSSSGSFSVV
jgi:hypothetical protein